MHFHHHRQGATIATTMSLNTGLLPPLFWAVRLGRGRPVCTRCFLALGAIEPLLEIANRGLQRFHFPLQGRFTLHKLTMLGAPVVRFPLELDIGLLCQHHRLLGEGGGVRRSVRRQGGRREQLWLRLFHEGCYTRLLRKRPWCSERREGLTEYLQFKYGKSLPAKQREGIRYP